MGSEPTTEKKRLPVEGAAQLEWADEVSIEPVMSVEELRASFMKLEEVKQFMTEGVDYGKFGNIKKLMLYKSGGQKLAKFFGLRVITTMLEEVRDYDSEKPLILYKYEAKVYPFNSDRLLANEIGICTSQDANYRWCNPGQPKGSREALIGQTHNVSSMASKRAYVAAVVKVTGASALFEDVDYSEAPSAQESAQREDKQRPQSSDKPKTPILQDIALIYESKAAPIGIGKVEFNDVINAMLEKPADQLTKDELNHLNGWVGGYKAYLNTNPEKRAPFKMVTDKQLGLLALLTNKMIEHGDWAGEEFFHPWAAQQLKDMGISDRAITSRTKLLSHEASVLIGLMNTILSPDAPEKAPF